MAKQRKKPETTLGKIWHFIWYEDSFLSWVVNIILAFILIKFIVYPGLGLLFGTTHPVVAVVSNSMEHDERFNEWWNDNNNFYEEWNISKEEFQSFNLRNGFNKGDIMFLAGKKPQDIKVGDIIVFQARNKPYPIIHRVIQINQIDGKIYFETKGDNNPDQIKTYDLNESNIPESMYIGKSVFRIPFVGYIKIWFNALITIFV